MWLGRHPCSQTASSPTPCNSSHSQAKTNAIATATHDGGQQPHHPRPISILRVTVPQLPLGPPCVAPLTTGPDTTAENSLTIGLVRWHLLHVRYKGTPTCPSRGRIRSTPGPLALFPLLHTICRSACLQKRSRSDHGKRLPRKPRRIVTRPSAPSLHQHPKFLQNYLKTFSRFHPHSSVPTSSPSPNCLQNSFSLCLLVAACLRWMLRLLSCNELLSPNVL